MQRHAGFDVSCIIHSQECPTEKTGSSSLFAGGVVGAGFKFQSRLPSVLQRDRLKQVNARMLPAQLYHDSLDAQYVLRRHGFISTMQGNETKIRAENVATETRLMNTEELAASR
jgi:hypothetical protein